MAKNSEPQTVNDDPSFDVVISPTGLPTSVDYEVEKERVQRMLDSDEDAIIVVALAYLELVQMYNDGLLSVPENVRDKDSLLWHIRKLASTFKDDVFGTAVDADLAAETVDA